MTQALITPTAVVVALSDSERFPSGSPQFEVFAPFIGNLIDIIGPDHLDDLVSMSNLCDATSRFIGFLAKNEEFLGSLDPDEAALASMIYTNLAEQVAVASMSTQSMLDKLGITEAQAMESGDLGLNDTAKQLYRAGRLTFAELLTVNPDVFIPKT